MGNWSLVRGRVGLAHSGVVLLDFAVELQQLHQLDEIREAQSVDDSLQPVMQALKDQVKPPHHGIREFPEDARILLSKWDSLVLQDGASYRKFHYPDGSTNFLQIVLPTKIRLPYIEHLHADLGHFGQA